jgi:hypothetical protein
MDMSDEEIDDLYVTEMERQREQPEPSYTFADTARVYLYWILLLAVSGAFWWEASQ